VSGRGPVRGRRPGRAFVALALLPALLAGCLSVTPPPTPVPGPPTPRPTLPPTPGPRDPETLVAAIPPGPVPLLPPAPGPAGEIVTAALYDALYRFSADLSPQPLLAAELPAISEDGRTLTLSLAGTDLVFQDGTPLVAADVAFSLLLGSSAACPFGRPLCDAAANLLSVETSGTTGLSLTLRDPDQSFLAEVLTRLPILEELAVREGVDAILAATDGTDPAGPEVLLERVADAMSASDCGGQGAPFGCRLGDHVGELERTLTAAEVPIPDRGPWTAADGQVDEDGYATALLDLVASLGRLLTADEADRYAAGLPLLDPAVRPLGSGPFAIERIEPGRSIHLVRNERHAGGPPAIRRIELRTVADAETAALLLASGVVDWLPEVADADLPFLRSLEGIRAGTRPTSVLRAILFNVRPGRTFDDPEVRRAFALCLDLARLVPAATGGAAVAVRSWTAPGSWGLGAGSPPDPDPAEAARILDAAGWAQGADGIRERGGSRLSTTVAVRSGRADLVAFAGAAADELAACGIELRVEELDLAGSSLLEALQWPNDFDTLLLARPLGVDPDEDLAAYDGGRVTSAENPADANPGGFSDPEVDTRLALARTTLGQGARAQLYREVGDLLDAALPAIPLWYEPASAAISLRVREATGPVDPGRPRYAADLAGWSLGPLP